MVVVANNLRLRHSPSFIIDELYELALGSQKNCVIESIRTPGEIDSLRHKGNFCLFAVDADPKIRFQRIFARQSETDQINYQTFLENEKREMDADDPNKQNLRRCIEMADFVFSNDGSIEKLHQQVEEVLSGMKL